MTLGDEIVRLVRRLAKQKVDEAVEDVVNESLFETVHAALMEYGQSSALRSELRFAVEKVFDATDHRSRLEQACEDAMNGIVQETIIDRIVQVLLSDITIEVIRKHVAEQVPKILASPEILRLVESAVQTSVDQQLRKMLGSVTASKT